MRFSPPSLSVLIALVLKSAMAADIPSAPEASTPVIEIDLNAPARPVSPTLHGLMTEEINYSYDGGLYAELIRNRAFLDDPKGNDPLHWSVVKDPGAEGEIRVVNTHPLTHALPNSLEVEVKEAGEGKTFGVANDGYWGIPLRPDTLYRVSFYAKGSMSLINRKTKQREGSDFTGKLTVSLRNADGSTIFAKAESPALQKHWQKIELTLKTRHDVKPSTDNRFVISASEKGTFWLSLVSLFPPTHKNRPNGFRPDLMEKMVAMKPKFLRFPGGNYLEGKNLWERFDWKATLGDLPFRKGHACCWDYRSSDGMGLMEFMNWCEDLGAEPVLGVFAGYSLHQQPVAPGPLLDFYVQEALDEVEFLTGDAKTTYWGAQRAKLGHPEPYRVNYVEIGNEDYFDQSGSYDGRFTRFYDAFKAKYPEIRLIATDRAAKTRTPDLYDDHFYRKAEGFYKDLAHYDTMDRNGPKVFVGEWATREGDSQTPNFLGALGDAAWMTSMERNSDLIAMHCYAPLFVNVNPGGMQWKCNLIGYNALESYGSPSYHAQVMFSNHIGDVTPKSELKDGGKVFLPYSVTRDTKTGILYLKVVNPGPEARSVRIDVKGSVKGIRELKTITLSADGPQSTNSITEPAKIVPVTTVQDKTLKTGAFERTFAPWSITVIELKPE